MNLLSTLSVVWPLAVGAAISPSITIICFALLASPTGRIRVLAFWSGAALALLVWAIIVSSFVWQLVQWVTHGVEDATHSIERYSRLIDLCVGVLLVLVGLLRLVKRPTTSSKNRLHIANLDSGPLWKQGAFGAVMQGRNLTSILMFIAAQQHIDAAAIPNLQKIGITAAVIVIATASIWLVLAIPKRWMDEVGKWLEPAHGWVSRNARNIEVATAVGVGVFLIIRSLFGLLTSGNIA